MKKQQQKQINTDLIDHKFRIWDWLFVEICGEIGHRELKLDGAIGHFPEPL